jgi:hypothetical protein
MAIDANPDIYEMNWEKVLGQCLKFHNGKEPLYVGMNISPSLYKGFEKNLTVSGLAYRFSATALDLGGWNRKLYDEMFLLDSIKHPLCIEQNQANVDMQNLNYIDFFKAIYTDSLSHKELARAQQIKNLAINLVSRMGHPEWDEQVSNEFK